MQATLAVFTGDSAELLNKRTDDGNTALHIAAGLLWDNVEMHLKLLRLLMNKGANPTAQNKQNQVPRQTVPLEHPGHQEVGTTGDSGCQFLDVIFTLHPISLYGPYFLYPTSASECITCISKAPLNWKNQSGFKANRFCI